MVDGIKQAASFAQQGSVKPQATQNLEKQNVPSVSGEAWGKGA